MKKVYMIISLVSLILIVNSAFAQNDATNSLLDSCDIWHLDITQMKNAVKDGANVNFISPPEDTLFNHKQSILCGVVLYSCSGLYEYGLEAFDYLVDNGALPQNEDTFILYPPITTGRIELVERLLKLGVSSLEWDCEAIDFASYHMTPVEEAASEGLEEIVLLLQNYGAPQLGNYKKNLLRMVRLADSGESKDFVEIVEKVISVNYINPSGETALINILNKSVYNLETIRKLELLIEKNVDLNQLAMCDFGINTPLGVVVGSSVWDDNDKSVQESAIDVIQLLINHGAFISGRNNEGLTPLHIAAKNNKILPAEILLEVGCKVNPKDDSGKTPFDYAESLEMINLLRKYGAQE